MTDSPQSHDAQTTPVGARTICPQCGVQLDAFTTSCGACGAVITGGALDTERAERMRARLQSGVGDGYKLGDMLGRGGMGIVYQARELALDRDVALKVLAFDPVLNPEAFTRFEREAKLAARLDHPNIVPIFSVGQGNGIAFYTMRMVRGGSAEALVAAGAMSLDRALGILRDVASALDYAHTQGVVHRDIKPANVLLSDSGHAMVADFGIARAFSGPTSSGATATGTGVVGSPAYMSPEQWRGEKVDGRADQYALGVLAFELLTGRRPFASDSMQELLRMHLAEDAPDIISVRHDLPAHLAEPIRRAMAKDPSSRFASAKEFVESLAGKGVAPSHAAQASSSPPAAVTERQRVAPPPAAAPVTVPGDAPSRRSALPWVALLVIAGVGAGVIWKLAPSQGAKAMSSDTGAPPAPITSASALDSIAKLEAALQTQLAEARKLALDAEKARDAADARNASAPVTKGAPPVPAEPAHAHLYVFAQGGAPQVVIDGASRNEAAPAVFQVSPGKHTVSVRGAQEFFPRDTSIELAAEDTETVIFRSLRFQNQARQVANAANATNAASADSATAATQQPKCAAKSLPPAQYANVTRQLGFDPCTTDPRTMTPEQRQRWRRFLQMADSVRRKRKP